MQGNNDQELVQRSQLFKPFRPPAADAIINAVAKQYGVAAKAVMGREHAEGYPVAAYLLRRAGELIVARGCGTIWSVDRADIAVSGDKLATGCETVAPRVRFAKLAESAL